MSHEASTTNHETISVVLSRVPADEQELWGAQFVAVEAALQQRGICVACVDSIYDLREDDPGAEFLRSLTGEMIVLGWHHPRALKWTLARQGVNVAGRTLYCMDLRGVKPDAVTLRVSEMLAGRVCTAGASPAPASVTARWYPVVDAEKCTNCMECMDFCLFGVYGVDHTATLRVVQPDQCRVDCPACSRVCPAGAIIFPKYRSNETIAGSLEGAEQGGVKLNLSDLFGKPQGRHQAALERDGELQKVGRNSRGAEQVQKLAQEFEKLEL
ncbi:MAG TPA: ferredoxin family protein [Planctomycetota bacterium]|jgi:hypothetical protein